MRPCRRFAIAARASGSSRLLRTRGRIPSPLGGVALALALAGCGKVGGTPDAAPSIDAASKDAASDAAHVAICDPTAVFGSPALLPGFSTSADEVAPRLSQDELTLYFSSNPAAVTQAHDLYIAQRNRVQDPFGEAHALEPLNSAAEDYDPTLSADGKTLIFTSNRKTGEGFHLYVATRSTTLAAFESAALLDGVGSANTADNDIFPFLSADGQELWFSSNRLQTDARNYDIYRAVRGPSGFANPNPVMELSSDTVELGVPSADLRTVYFHTKRGGGSTIWSSHRTTAADGFPAPHADTELMVGASAIPGWMSPDNCRLYLNSSGPGDLYVATRQPQ